MVFPRKTKEFVLSLEPSTDILFDKNIQQHSKTIFFGCCLQPSWQWATARLDNNKDSHKKILTLNNNTDTSWDSTIWFTWPNYAHITKQINDHLWSVFYLSAGQRQASSKKPFFFVKAVTYNERPKMKRDTRQKSSLFLSSFLDVCCTLRL